MPDMRTSDQRLKEIRAQVECFTDSPMDCVSHYQFLLAEVAKLDRLNSIIAGHKQDEKQGHRRTRELLAAQLGVEVDTEAYDAAVDAAKEAQGD